MLTLYLSLIDDDRLKVTFEEVFNRYNRLMYNRAYDILKDKALAEDAVQDAFFSVLKNISNIREVDSPRTRYYVLTITENAAKKIYNKEHRFITVELSENIEDRAVADRLRCQEELQPVVDRLAKMPKIYRDVLILKYFNNLSDKEIASALNISLHAQRKRFQRGREMLLAAIKECENDEN